MEQDQVFQLIEEVRKRPQFWNKKKPGFELKRQKGEEWKRVASILNIDKTVIQNKWKSISEIFKREYKKVQNSIRSGAGAADAYVSADPYYKSLLFLKDTLEPAKTESNIECLNDEEQEQSDEKENILIDPIDQLHNDHKVSSIQKKDISSELPRRIDFSAKHHLNMAFFETLMLDVGQIKPEEKLNFRNEITTLVQGYAYPNSTAGKLLQLRKMQTEREICGIAADENLCSGYNTQPMMSQSQFLVERPEYYRNQNQYLHETPRVMRPAQNRTELNRTPYSKLTQNSSSSRDAESPSVSQHNNRDTSMERDSFLDRSNLMLPTPKSRRNPLETLPSRNLQQFLTPLSVRSTSSNMTPALSVRSASTNMTPASLSSISQYRTLSATGSSTLPSYNNRSSRPRRILQLHQTNDSGSESPSLKKLRKL